MGVARRFAVRRRVRRGRPADHRHRQPRQDVPPRRRPAAADAASPARRPSRSRRSTATRAVGCTTRPPTPARCSACRHAARATRHLRIGAARRADGRQSWGAISWRGVDAGRQPRRDLHALGQYADARRHVERVVAARTSDRNGSPITSPKARYLQWRAVLTGKSDTPVLTSVTAAYLQRNLRPQVRSITVHPPGIVFQKPFSTGDPDLAGFDNQTTPDRKLTKAAMSPQVGKLALARPPDLSERAADAGLARRRRERRRAVVRRSLSPRGRDRLEGPAARTSREQILVWDTTTVPNGTYFVKIVASDAPVERRRRAR